MLTLYSFKFKQFSFHANCLVTKHALCHASNISGFRREADEICAILVQRMVVIRGQLFGKTYLSLADGNDRLY
jgi:hypothetical protein